MALPVLDGNQSATTLSSVVTGGEHIVAHSVVCFGSTAISNITNAVSGSVVSVSNFPSTQTIAGTVTANIASIPNVLLTGSNGDPINDGGAIPVFLGQAGEIYGTVTANNSTIDLFAGALESEGTADAGYAVRVQAKEEYPLPISGTVTANAGTELGTIGNTHGFIALGVDDVGTASALSLDGNGNLRAAVGTVTAAAPNGSLTTRFGTPTTANTAFATSAVTNASRKYLLIQNVTTGSNVITVGIGFTPTTTQGIQLTAGAGITFESSYIPTGAVYVLSSVTASNFTILEA